MILEAAFAIAVDGDTLKIQGERVRLWRINAPEIRKARGRAARSVMAARLLQGAAICHVWTKDRYGRHVGQCYVKGEDVAWTLLREGLAEDWPRYSKGYYKVSGYGDT